MNKRKILIVGSIPATYNGVTISIENLLSSLIKEKFTILHLETSDKRSLAKSRKLDFNNVFLAVNPRIQFLWIALIKRPKLVCVLNSRS